MLIKRKNRPRVFMYVCDCVAAIGAVKCADQMMSILGMIGPTRHFPPITNIYSINEIKTPSIENTNHQGSEHKVQGVNPGPDKMELSLEMDSCAGKI